MPIRKIDATATGGGIPGAWALEGGLVDAHLHLALDFVGLRLNRTDLIARNLLAVEDAGILGARDIGAPPDAPDMLAMARARLQIASRLLGPAGRSYPEICEHVSEHQLVDRGAALARAGADWVKVIWDFPGADGDWLAARQNYSTATLRLLVEAVHDAGARVAVHTTGPAVAEAVRAGVDTIEHGVRLDRAALESMADQGIAWVPTLFAAHKHLDPLRSYGPDLAAVVDRTFDHYETLLEHASELGVAILAGSDETPAGELWREVQLLGHHGLGAEPAIACASTVPRQVFGLPIVPGDLVTYDSDPRADLGALARPAAVVRAGVRLV